MQDFEYALKRKAAMREDYLRYIGEPAAHKYAFFVDRSRASHLPALVSTSPSPVAALGSGRLALAPLLQPLNPIATPSPPSPEYEERLEELRASRRSSRSISGKAGLAEYCIVRRIHFVYERATRKFR